MLFTEQTCVKQARQDKNTPNPPLNFPPVAAWISRSLFTLTPTSFGACSSADLQKPKNTLGSVNSDPQHYKSPKLCYRRLVLSPDHPGSVTTPVMGAQKEGADKMGVCGGTQAGFVSPLALSSATTKGNVLHQQSRVTNPTPT